MSRIRELRKEKGLSQEELGKLLNVQKAAISKYERNIIEPSKTVLLKMSEILQVSTDYLLGSSNQHTLTSKDEKDVLKKLEDIKVELESQEGLLFSGGEMDDDTRDLLLLSLERALRQSKAVAKEKFTPNKYKK